MLVKGCYVYVVMLKFFRGSRLRKGAFVAFNNGVPDKRLEDEISWSEGNDFKSVRTARGKHQCNII